MEPAVRVAVVESRPGYVTVQRLKALRLAAKERTDIAIEVAIGLDAYDDFLRQNMIRKGFTRSAFERAVKRMGEADVDLVAYIMLKPFEISEAAALRDAQQSALYIHEVAADHGVRARIALEPTFVAPHTPLAKEYTLGRYTPPSLWLVRDATARIAQLGPLAVGMWDEDLQPLAIPSSCPSCRQDLITALHRFNVTQDPSFLEVSRCPCADIPNTWHGS